MMLRNKLVLPLALFACLVLWRLRFFGGPSRRALTFVEQVERLHVEATLAHEAMLSSQSRTLSTARKEYVRRYGMNPPPGFDIWYDYAMDQHSPIIDEFDSIMEDLKPFSAYINGPGWNEGRCDLYAQRDPNPDLVQICIKEHKVSVDSNIDPAVKQKFIDPFEDMVSDFLIHIRDVCFELNILDEPRLAVPYAGDESLNALEVIQRESGKDSCVKQKWQDLSKQNIWDTVIRSCPKDSPARTGAGLKSPLSPTEALIQDWRDATELCLLPQAPPHGLIQSPVKMSLGDQRVPVFSSSKLSLFQDIRYPNFVRWADGGGAEDMFAFDVKRHVVGWRGVSTGGWAEGDNWRDFHRHRMVSLAQAQAIEGAPPSRKFGGQNLISTTPQLRKSLDIGFTELVSCESSACDEMKKEFRIVPSLMQIQIFANKMVLDMDGEGLSPRHYQLLRSNSAIIKQGLLREWHDERLVPWVHYIPLSIDMTEMPELLAYLFDTARGDNITEAIAVNSKNWTKTALRQADMRVYMYRLLLEMSRRDFSPA